MAYIGNDLEVAFQSYLIIDDISGDFDGIETSFTLNVNGAVPVPFPINPQQCLISVAGVIQEPDPTGSSGFNLSGNNIVFSSAPASSASFFGVVLAGADYVNVGVDFPAGSVAAPSITFVTDKDTGFFSKAANEIGIACAGTEVGVFSSTGLSSGFADGSAASPSIFFTSDTNTGIARAAADELIISTGGVERASFGSSEVVFNDPSNDVDFRVESNGNTHMLFVDAGNDRVGIGTSSPDSLLTLDGSSNPTINIKTSGTKRASLIADTGNSYTLLGSFDGYPLVFSASAGGGTAERARIDTSGRLLVGTSSSPSSGQGQYSNLVALGGAGTTYGNISIGSTSAATSLSGGDNIGLVCFTDNDGNEFARISSAADATPGSSDHPGRLVFSTTADGASSPTERLRIDSSGNVGIGTNSPQQFVHVSDAGSSDVVRVRIQQESSNTSTNGGGLLELGGTRSDGTYGQYGAVKGGRRNSASDNKGYSAFFSDNGDGDSIAERVRITHGSSNGADIRLNCTDDPSASSKGSSIKPNGSNGNYYQSAAATTSTYSHAQFVNPNGVVGSIQTTSSSTNFVTTSDYRLKENLVGLDGAITRVKQLAPKRFNFIADDSTTVDGFLAHEAQTVVPEAVTGAHNAVKVWQEGEELPDGVSVGDNKLDEDGNTIPDYQGIDQSKLVPLLTAALQEAIAKIETLEAKVAALEAG